MLDVRVVSLSFLLLHRAQELLVGRLRGARVQLFAKRVVVVETAGHFLDGGLDAHRRPIVILILNDAFRLLRRVVETLHRAPVRHRRRRVIYD